MSRRDTIIIAVLVNTALLAVLFITAVNSKNRVEEPKLVNSVLLEETTIDAKELFSSTSENKDTIATKELVPQEAQKEFVSLIDEKENKRLPKEEERVLYKLPQIAKNVEEKKQDIFQPFETLEITIEKGDSLDKIARIHRVKISEIMKLNNLQNSFLKIGQVLLIPKTSSEFISKQEHQFFEEQSPKSLPEYYTIKVGDNPYTIAIKHSIKPTELLKLNNLDEKKAKKLKPGDKLRIR